MLNNLGTVNLVEGPLAAPQWEINLDENQGEEYALGLMNEYEEWFERFDQIMSDWERDAQLVEDYYWRYEMMPLLEEGSKLDEKTLRTVVTYIAESTTIAGQPMADAIPGVQEMTLDYYDPEGPSLYAEFGFVNLNRENFSLETARVSLAARVENRGQADKVVATSDLSMICVCIVVALAMAAWQIKKQTEKKLTATHESGVHERLI